MKKSELTQLTQIIEQLVAREIRKQLPAVIAETFQKMMGNKQTIVTEVRHPVREVKEVIEEQVEPTESSVGDSPSDFKASLRELFAGTPVVRTPEANPRQPKQYTKDPKLNAILNETVGDLRAREGMVGLAAFQGGYSSGGMLGMTGAGQMMAETEQPAFARGMPTMPAPVSIPMGTPPVLAEGQVSNHAPLEALPQGLSVLDVAKQVQLPGKINEALTNYDRMKKILNQSKGRR